MGINQWDSKLMSPERAIRLVGDWPWYVSLALARLSQFAMEGGGTSQPDQWQVNLRCGRCNQSAGLLLTIDPSIEAESYSGPRVTGPELLSGQLRHLVMAHDVSLSGGSDDG